jgi:hypothetical protein
MSIGVGIEFIRTPPASSLISAPFMAKRNPHSRNIAPTVVADGFQTDQDYLNVDYPVRYSG